MGRTAVPDAPVAIINAAGKLTALGGSAQSQAVAAAQATAAQSHVDLQALRDYASAKIASLTGAEAACVTTGAAAGITISIAALVSGGSAELIRLLPQTREPHDIALQAGHAVNFGASIEQMIRLGGGRPRLVGDTNLVTPSLLDDNLRSQPTTAFLYVKSHHCVQDNMVDFDTCLSICREHQVPIVVDAAAEEDLHGYIAAGADLVTYSGGKAFGGPTVGFICGRADLIRHCEQQFRGIARTMKVGKEQIAGLLEALSQYSSLDEAGRLQQLEHINSQMMAPFIGSSCFHMELKPDEAGRPFARVGVAAKNGQFDIESVVKFLASGEPSIRTRNHHLDQGYLLLDPRELKPQHVASIVARLAAFADKQ